MSISRKSSYDTFVVEKISGDQLQFLANPQRLRKHLDLKGLSDIARKSFGTLKLWQNNTSWYVIPY